MICGIDPGRGRKKKARTVLKNCLECGKDKSFYLSDIRKGGGKYCSHKCRSIHCQRGGGHNRKTLTMKSKGYILEWAPNHPRHVKGYVFQHRLVVERLLGRHLTKKELVHHKNGIKSDNRPENLEVMSAREHMSEHKAVWVRLNGEPISNSEACRRIGITRASVRDYRSRLGVSHQDAIDHYARKYGYNKSREEI